MTRATVISVKTKDDDFWGKYYKYGPVVSPELGNCWLWTGATDEDGYGILGWDGRIDKAHRVAYKLTYGEPPAGHVVMHKCDNPPCGNPKHLTSGTNEDNLKDMAEKGRARGGRRTKDGQEPKNRRKE